MHLNAGCSARVGCPALALQRWQAEALFRAAERPRRDAAEQRYELAAPHVPAYLGNLLSNCCATRMMSHTSAT